VKLDRNLRILGAWFTAAGVWGAEYHVVPGKGAAGNPGSAEQPWRTLEEAAAQGFSGRVRAGDTVWLGTGDHGAPVLQGDFTATVTVSAAPGARPRVSSLTVDGRNWLVKGLIVSPEGIVGGERGRRGALVVAGEGDGEDITIADCFVYGALDSSRWTAPQWMNAPTGMAMGRNGRKIVFRNNHILNVRFGITMASFDSVAEGNVVENFSADGFRMMRNGQTMQHNVIRNVYVSDADGDKNHDDGVQCFLFNAGTGLISNFTIRENIILMREDESQPLKNGLQAIGAFDGPLRNFVVEGNVICTQHWHGISLYDAQGCRILDNVIFNRWGGRMSPWIQLGTKNKGGCRDNVVEGNYAHSFNLGDSTQVAAKDNRTVSAAVFNSRLAELRKKIEDTYGKRHPVSGRPRLK